MKNYKNNKIMALAALWLLAPITAIAQTEPAKPPLRICSAINRPPMEYFNAAQQPVGIDIDLANVLASRLNMTASFINTPFAGLIPSLLAGHCDIIMAQLFIKPARLKVIDEIPYMSSQVDYIFKAGKPKISSPEDLSGRKIAGIIGTTSIDIMNDTNKTLAAAHRPPINIMPFSENSSALQQVEFGQVDGYAVAYETGLYYTRLQPKIFELGGAPFGKIATGIGISKQNKPLEAAITIALDGIRKDGSYAMIFKRWDLEGDMLP